MQFALLAILVIYLVKMHFTGYDKPRNLNHGSDFILQIKEIFLKSKTQKLTTNLSNNGNTTMLILF